MIVVVFFGLALILMGLYRMSSYFLNYDIKNGRSTLKRLSAVFYGTGCYEGIERDLSASLLEVIFSFFSIVNVYLTILKEFIRDLEL